MKLLPHIKTILVFLVSIGIISFLYRHPNAAMTLYKGIWVLMILMFFGWIYSMIYSLFDTPDETEPQPEPIIYDY